MSKKIAVYPGYSNMLKDAMFDLESEAGKQLRGLPIFERYIALRKYLNEKGIEIHTYDMYQDLSKIDIWLVFEMFPKRYLFFARHLIPMRKIIPMIMEPAIVNPWEWKNFNLWSRFHKTIITWSPDLIKQSKKCVRYHYIPYAFDVKKCETYRSKAKNKFSLLLQSNKASKVKGELYSLRRSIVRYFEKRGDGLLDLYGYGWNTQKTRHLGPSKPFYTSIYKGEAGDKWEIFSEYKYIFCIQNSIPAGLFEGDAFMAMSVGAVPIFLPPSDTSEFIPENTYINYSKFKSLDDLADYLKKIENTQEYEDYKRNGWEYINSPKFKPFSVDQYAEDVYKAILSHEKRLNEK